MLLSAEWFETRQLLSLFMDKYVALMDIPKLENVLTTLWSQRLNKSVSVHLVRQKEFTSLNG